MAMSRASQFLIGRYLALDSPLHRLGALAKLLILIAFLVTLVLVKSFAGFGLMAVLLVVGVIASRIPAGFLVRGMRPVLWVIAIFALFHLFFTKGGGVLLAVGFVTIELEGLIQAMYVACRLTMIIIAASLFTLSTPVLSAAQAVERLLKPLSYLKVPTAEIGIMLALALRFIPIVLEEGERLNMAQMARGRGQGRPTLWGRARDLLALLVPVLANTMKRADNIALAMELRGYEPRSARTSLVNVAMSGREWVLVVVVIGVLVGIAVLV
jgi:energy-coupling factor transport system permease protein